MGSASTSASRRAAAWLGANGKAAAFGGPRHAGITDAAERRRIAAVLMPGVSAASGGVVQLPGVPKETWAVGLLLMILIGTVVGLLPALRAMRLNIVDALAGR